MHLKTSGRVLPDVIYVIWHSSFPDEIC